MTGIFVLLGFIAGIEIYRFIMKKKKENTAIYIELEGKFIAQEIINKSYYASTGIAGRTITGIKNLFILVYKIEDRHGRVIEVNVAQSQYYNSIAGMESLNKGAHIRIKVKKYPHEDMYIFVENI